MKTVLTIFLTAFSLSAFSQAPAIEVKQRFLSEIRSLGAHEISERKQMLDANLSSGLHSKVMKSSSPYYIENVSEIQSMVEAQKATGNPQFALRLNTFEGEAPLDLSIARIDALKGRNILRGNVSGYPESQVNLVVYNGQITGRISLTSEPRVLVIRSVSGGVTATYEIDTSDITYD